MQITITADPTKVGEDVASILSTLSTEQKEKIALQVVTAYLQQPHDFEIKAAEHEIIEKIKAGLDDYDKRNGRYQTDDDIRKNHSKYSDWLKSYKDTRTIMIEHISQVAQNAQREAIKQLVADDPQIQKMITEAVAKFTENFPAMAQTALTGMFTSYLSSISHNLSNLNVNQSALHQDVGNMNQRLLNSNQRY